MTKLTNPDEIWVIESQISDRATAARYAERTLPWTFNRMMLNTGPRGQGQRAINIAKGIVAQEMLGRAFRERGLECDVQYKSHRADDLFDFTAPFQGNDVLLDIKSWLYYSDYEGVDRAPLSRELIVSNRAYPGPDWRTFFPMMVPHTQIGQNKGMYCFAFGSSVNPQGHNNRVRDAYHLCAFPYGPHLGFLSNKALCRRREEAGQGYYVRGRADTGMFSEPVNLTIIGEWAGEMSIQTVTLGADLSHELGPFSVIDGFRIDYDDCTVLGNGTIELVCSRNDFTASVRNTTGENINRPPDGPLVLRKQDFVNLMLPPDYKLYVLGWIEKEEYLDCCRLYPSWVWPQDSVDKYANQPWNQITDKDRNTVARAGFDDSLFPSPPRLRAGWMKTSGHGNGACCYVFPNIHGGGVKEHNLYVLPQDLNIMDEFAS